MLKPAKGRLLRTLQPDLIQEQGVVFRRELVVEECFRMDTNTGSFHVKQLQVILYVFHSVLYQLTNKSGYVKSNTVLPSIYELLMTSIAS